MIGSDYNSHCITVRRIDTNTLGLSASGGRIFPCFHKHSTFHQLIYIGKHGRHTYVQILGNFHLGCILIIHHITDDP